MTVDIRKKEHVTAREIAQMYGLSEYHVRDVVVHRTGFPKRLTYCRRPYKWKRAEVDKFFNQTE